MRNQWNRAVWVRAAVSALAVLAVGAVALVWIYARHPRARGDLEFQDISVLTASDPRPVPQSGTTLLNTRLRARADDNIVKPPPMQETFPAVQPPVVITPAPVVHQELPAWQKFAVKAQPANGRPRIVIIIDDMGMDRMHSKEITQLPGPLTLSYMPYPPHIRDEVAEGRAAGDEIMMHMPMEPIDARLMTGDYFLTTKMSTQELKATLDRDLAAFDGFVGMNNHMGSRLTQDRAAMDVVMADLAARGMLFVDSRTIASSVAAQSAEVQHLPQVSRDVFLDDVETVSAVNKQLSEVERVARGHGLAVAIGHPKAVTITALKAWLPSLAAKGFVLEPVSAVVSEDPHSAKPVLTENTEE